MASQDGISLRAEFHEKGLPGGLPARQPQRKVRAHGLLGVDLIPVTNTIPPRSLTIPITRRYSRYARRNQLAAATEMKPSSAPAVLPMRLKILFIGHSYHTVTKSSEFFINHLETIGEVSTEFDDCWKGIVQADYRPILKSFDMVVVWQLPQVIAAIAKSGHPNLVFVPMYDSVHKLGRVFWNKLKKVKIVCFSPTLRATCLSYDLDSYFLQYYPEGSAEAKVGYESRRMFFWQRRAVPNWQTLTSVLPVSQFERLHHHVAMDPGLENSPERSIVPTASEIQQKNFGNSTWFEKKTDLIAKLSEFNLFFLPREREGIGFSFLDCMEIGMIPVGFNLPTFNEYVVDGVNGFIVDKKQRLDLPALVPVAANMRHYLRKGRINYQRSLERLGGFLLRPVVPPPKYSGLALLRKFAPKLYRRWQQRKRELEIPVINASRGRFQGGSPLVTVVTVVRNNASGLAKTFQSVFSQTFDKFEYIVIDGNSTDDTLNIIRLHEGSIDSHLSEKDRGHYDAMMKGAALARGRYVIYMNAGDEFAEITSLEDAMESCPEDAEVIYGHYYFVIPDRVTKLKLVRNLDLTYQTLKNGDLTSLWQSGLPCHQSSIVAKDLILRIGFDPTLVVAADHALVYDACAQGAKTHHTNTVISKYYAGGLSGKMQSQCVKDWRKVSLKHTNNKDAVKEFYRKMGC